MSDRTDPQHAAQGLPRTRVDRRRSIPLVWWIPIVALLVGAGVIYDSYASRGPTVTLRFSDGQGLEAGKTRIKYKSVEIGLLTSIRLSDDLSGVVAEAEMDPGTEGHLTDATAFWRVTPQVGFSGVTGLDTLVSGAYVAVYPAAGTPQREFEVADHAPIDLGHRDALHLRLRSARGAVPIGAPVTWRGMIAGEVTRTTVADDGEGFVIHALVDRPFADGVRAGTRFWRESGIDVSLGAAGLEVHAGSVRSIVTGGIAFDGPEEAEGPALEPGAELPLFANEKAAKDADVRAAGLIVRVEARDATALSDGAPVLYRKSRIGRVLGHALSPDARTIQAEVLIEARFAPLVRANTRFWNASGVRVEMGPTGLAVETGPLAQVVGGGLSLATPDRPGAPAEPGRLFALAEEPSERWLAWAPEIWLAGEDPSKAVAHALPRTARPAGLAIELVSDEAGSVSPGAGVYFRRLRVGEIVSRELAGDARTVRIHARIERRYAHLVRQNSRFWNASGIGVDMGLGGLRVQTESMEALLAGGVAFATPDPAGAPAKRGSSFALHGKGRDEWRDWAPALGVGGSAPAAVTAAGTAGTARAGGFWGRLLGR